MKGMKWITVGILGWSGALLLAGGAFGLENSDCLDCHGDSSLTRKAAKGGDDSVFVDQKVFQYSIHNVNSVRCADCHTEASDLDSSKEVPHKVTMTPVNCGACHEAEATEYSLGVHQKASRKGLVIQCYACHGYHDVVNNENKTVLERENRSCLKCHNPGRYHNWLSQKETHFSYVQCTVCHAPDMPHHLNLRLYDLAKKEFLQPEKVLATLGTDFNGLVPMFNRDAKTDELNAEEFENMVFALNRRGLYVGVHAELLSDRDPRVHHVTKVSAKRACADCHAAEAPFFDSVSMALIDKEGNVHRYKLDRKVLESYAMSNFYMPGGVVSKVRRLDMIGGLCVLGAGAGILLHLVGRIATAPMRKRRHEEHE